MIAEIKATARVPMRSRAVYCVVLRLGSVVDVDDDQIAVEVKYQLL